MHCKCMKILSHVAMQNLDARSLRLTLLSQTLMHLCSVDTGIESWCRVIAVSHGTPGCLNPWLTSPRAVLLGSHDLMISS